MAQALFTGKERVGRVTVERNGDYVRIRWTLKGKTYSLNVGKDSRATIQAARAKAGRINDDITFDRFDATLERYGKSTATVLEVVPPSQPKEEISLRQLWNKFLADKIPNLKAKTQDEYHNFTKLLDKVDRHLSFDAPKTKQALLEVTTIDQTRRMLQYLSACCQWGIRHREISDNPYNGLAADLPKRKSLTDPNPDAFTAEERDAVIEAFKNDKRSGMNYSHYASIVEFWFLTGCRPSEAIGLIWKNVSKDCSTVSFIGSVQTVRGKQVWSDGSKNNKIRAIAVSARVQELLISIKPETINPEDYVFPSPKGKAINYPNFLSKIWGKLVDPIKPNTTPYNCRDTFITAQLLKGVPSAVIAKWCDTSTGMIDKNYADKLKLSQIRPTD